MLTIRDPLTDWNIFEDLSPLSVDKQKWVQQSVSTLNGPLRDRIIIIIILGK